MSKYSRRPKHFAGHSSLGKPRKYDTKDLKELERGSLIRLNAKESDSLIEISTRKLITGKTVYEVIKVSPRKTTNLGDYDTPDEALRVAKSETALKEKELVRGAKVESEHAKTTKQAEERIARDHLREDPSYYQKLAAVEAKTMKRRTLRGKTLTVTEYAPYSSTQVVRRVTGKVINTSTGGMLRSRSMTVRDKEGKEHHFLRGSNYNYEEREPVAHHSLRRVTAEPFHKKDTSLRLNIRTAVIVPSTHHGNKPVDKAEIGRAHV